jgi:RNA polymerase sigma-70 factor (ECF subfamily)
MNSAADLTLHLRLVDGDKSAPYDCVTRWLPELMRRLSGSFNEVAQRDEQLIEEAALETLFEYTANPHKYDAERSSLATYLTQAAKRDLINALEREKTQGRRATSIHPVEHQLTSGNNSFEEQVADNADAQVAWEVVMETITDPQDRSLLALLLQGERATTAFAKVLGITHLPEQEQRATVKRHKDRLDKRLQRLGETLNG